MNRTVNAWSIVLLALVGCVVYANTLNVPFHFDDQANIQVSALKLESLHGNQLKRIFTESTHLTRPVSNLSFALNHFVGGYRVQGYHLINILIHICSGIFFYLLLLVTLNLDVNQKTYGQGATLALMTTLLWTVHPLATQSVTYIVQRMNSMSAMFFILALLLYVKGREQQLRAGQPWPSLTNLTWFLASAISGLLAVGSKEIAATLPFFIFLYEWYFFQDLSWNWLKNKLYWLIGAFLFLGCIAYAYTNGQLVERILNKCSERDFTVIERVLTQFRVLIHYITLILYPNPDRLALDYDFPVSTSLFSPLTTLSSLIVVIVIVMAAILLARRERLLSFCILWFFGNLVIESSIICLEIIFEHRTYLPSMFLLLLAVATLFRLCRNSMLVAIPLILVAILFGFWTVKRNVVWQTSLALWSDSAVKHPGKARPHANLGLALAESGKEEQAEREYRRALEIEPSAPVAHNNLAALLLRQGRVDAAESHLREAIQLKPDYVDARMGYGGFFRERGQYEEAAEQFRRALDKEPENVAGNKSLGNALLRGGHPEEALPVLNKARGLSSNDHEVLLDLGEALSLCGQIDEAVRVYETILDKEKAHGATHYQLALLAKKQGREQDAVVHYRKADHLMQYPDTLKYDFGNLLLRLGEFRAAEQVYGEFVSISPTLAMARNNLGLSLVHQGRLVQAMEQFEAALRLDPALQLAADNLRLASEQLLGNGASQN